MINIEDILKELEDELLSGKKALFSGKIVADTLKVTELLAKLRDTLPDSIQNSRRILNEREDIMKEANQRADMIFRSAKDKAEKLTNESSIVQSAEKRAMEIVKEAEAYRDKMYYSVNTSLERMLKETETTMGDAIMLIHETREQLADRINKLNYRSDND
ncbi:MAG: hypothetical protein EOM87_03515 [Clostridia bacterium]|nr:hypothetical protein [Clostridia bacterium]